VDHWFLQPHPNKSFTNEYTPIVNHLTLKTVVKVAQLLEKQEIKLRFSNNCVLKVQAVQNTDD
jgi:hypothetical protein